MAKRFVYVKGTEIKRQTARNYTHAIVRFRDNEPTAALSYCGRLDLAEKALRDLKTNYGEDLKQADLRIVEVEERKK